MILTNEEIMVINQTAEFDSAIGYARAIEAKVLEKLNCLEPVAVVFAKCGGETMITGDLPLSTKLYALEKK